MKKINYELYRETIDIAGKDKMKALCQRVGTDKFSFARCAKVMEEDEIVQAYNQTADVPRVAKAFKKDKTYVYRLLRRLGML